MMTIAHFETLDEAAAWRAEHGGWIFCPGSGQPIWFSAAFTPSAILVHRATRGLAGKLI